MKRFCIIFFLRLSMALSMMSSISRGDSLASQMEVYLHYDNTLKSLFACGYRISL